MANLRDLIDCKAVDTMDKGDVYDHLKKTKVAQLNYDLEKAQLHQKLAPTRQMIDLVDKDHPMDDGQNQQQLDEQGNPVGLQNQQPMKPGMGNNVAKPMNQMRPATPMQQKKPGFPNANKTSTKSKMSAKPKPKEKPQSGRGFEVHVKAKGERIDQMNVKKKKLKGRYDYHDNAGTDQGAGRGMGLSGGGPGSGRHKEALDKVRNYIKNIHPDDRTDAERQIHRHLTEGKKGEEHITRNKIAKTLSGIDYADLEPNERNIRNVVGEPNNKK